ncbi:adenylosuccinate synthetase [Lewinella sp. 4G2]|uniref:adenylosuccinate synthetase n=1 Tax=Lewinella sp. 4G2 TaxID=1803372 RepID=UPI0007B48098|nr:adenylosuccinate synthetase [Lewinella sp. 4G2]OAV44438.1 hypothetical protein A3850_008000 [Lewinella sp. 4G2]
MKTQLVIGLGFGDEGKGLTTDFLCRQADSPLVVRFSGGHQAGHTVVTREGTRHVFSNFGAGTLAGAPTYYSRYCTFNPVGFQREREALLKLGTTPVLYTDGLAPVTTPYDVLYNRKLETKERHGSCGLGFGATVARHEGPAKLHVLDLYDDFILEQKLQAVATYYGNRLGVTYDTDALREQLMVFHDAVNYFRSHHPQKYVAHSLASLAKGYDTIVFEGSQGLLLDQDFGYFPHVTRAHVSSRNAMELIATAGLPLPEIFYVTRAYQTRHGNGPLTNEHLEPNLHPTPNETNVTNPWQGPQRRSLLDLDQLRFALAMDNHYAHACHKNLVVTCLDQLKGEWFATDDGRRIRLGSSADLGGRLGFTEDRVYTNASEVGDLLVCSL